MTEQTTPESDETTPETAPDEPDPTTGQAYAQGQTSDPDGAHREEPAGEDYAGSGF